MYWAINQNETGIIIYTNVIHDGECIRFSIILVAYMKNAKFSMTKILIHYATDVSSVAHLMDEKLQHNKSHTFKRNYSELSKIE